MNILLGTDSSPVDEGAGAERVLCEHAIRLAERGHEVGILYRKTDPHVESPEGWHGCRLHPYSVATDSAFSFLSSTMRNARAALRDVCESSPPDIACMHQPFTGLAFAGNRRIDFPLAYYFHSPAPAEYLSRLSVLAADSAGPARRVWHRQAIPQAMRLVEGRVLRRTSAIIVASESMGAELRRWHPRAARDPVHLVPGGVDTERFRPADDKGALRDRLGLPSDKKILFSLRFLVPRVGMENTLRAISELKRARDDFVYLIGGKGPLLPSLEALAADLGLHDKVRFLGFIPEPELPDWYGCADLYVQTDTHLQGFGLPILEALSCGTAVLATPVGGAREILAPLDGGRSLFSSLGHESMAREISAALDAGASVEFGARIRSFAEERFSWETIVDRLETCFEQTIAEHQS